MSASSVLNISSAYAVGGDVIALFWEGNMADLKKTDTFEIFRKTSSGSYASVPTFQNTPQLDTQGVNKSVDYALREFEDESVSPGTTYNYKVRVRDINGNYGPFSNEVTVLAQGAKYYISPSGSNSNSGSSVSPWQTFSYALGQVAKNVGNVIIHKAGSYTYNTIYTCNGLSVQGESRANVTVNSTLSYNPNWWDEKKPIFQWNGGGAANVIVKGINFTTSNDSSRGWSPLLFEEKTGWIVRDCRAENYFRSAVNGQTTGRNFRITNNLFYNCGQEENGFSSGNWTLKGSFTNGTIDRNLSDHNGKGYGAKIHYAYIAPFDTLTNTHTCFNTFTGKTGSAFAPEYNISREHFSMRQNGVVDSNNSYDMHTSDDTETPGVPSSGFAYYHHHNTYTIKRGQLAEDACSNVIWEDNVFDNRNNANGWGGIGEFNNGPTLSNKQYRRNVFYGGLGSIFVFTSNVTGLVFEYNTVATDTTLFEFRRGNSNGSKANYQIRYNVFDANIRMAYKTEGADGSVPQVVASEGNIFKSTPNWNGMNAFAATIATPALQRSGALPDPYYRHVTGGNADGKGAFTTSVAPPPVTNQPPSLTLSSPVDGQQIYLGQSVNVVFSANDTDGTIVNWELCVNGSTSQSSTTATNFTYTPAATGTYSIGVRVTDDKGATAEVTRTISVVNQPTTPTDPPPSTGDKTISKNLNLTLADGKYYITVVGLEA